MRVLIDSAVQSLDGDAFGDGAVLGCDFAGVVEDVGANSKLEVGDRIGAFVWGGSSSPFREDCSRV